MIEIRKNENVPGSEKWLPSGIVGKVGQIGLEDSWVLVRRLWQDYEGCPDAYRIYLPMEKLYYGDGPEDFVLGVLEDNLLPRDAGGFIDMVTDILQVEWFTSPDAWDEGRYWFQTQSRFRHRDLGKIERLLRRWLRAPRPDSRVFTAGPHEGPTM